MSASKLTCVFDNSAGGDKRIRFDRDESGNLYSTNNAETQARLTGSEWMGWNASTIRAAIAECVRDYGSEVGLNVASQCGGYEEMTSDQQSVVDEWNNRFAR